MIETTRLGRTFLFRFPDKVTAQDLPPFLGDARAAVGAMIKENRKLVSLGDLSATTAMPPDVTTQLVGLMRGDNPVIERTGVLTSNATLGLQLERMFREANNPARKTFRAHADLVAWTSELLGPDEIAAAKKWLRW